MQVRQSWRALLLKTVLMLGTTLGVALAFWNPLRNEVSARTRQATKAFVQSLHTDILDEVRHQTLAQVRLGNLLSIAPQPSEADWTDQAKLFTSHHPGYIAIQWVDADYRSRWVVVDDDDEAHRSELIALEPPLERMLQVLTNRCQAGAVFAPPFRLWNGNIGHRVVAPVCRKQDFLGFLIAVVDETKVLSDILADHIDSGYGIAVLEGDQQLFAAHSPESEKQKKWVEEDQIGLPGVMWRIRVWPDSAVLRQIESHLPGRAFLLGSLIGLLLFTTLDFARTSYLRSRDLLKTQDELELRVKERTAELQHANHELVVLINERKRAEESLQDLTGRLLRLRDEERRNVARELHDQGVQTMGAVALNLEKIQKLVPESSSKVRKLLADSSDLAEEAINELRTMSYLLHPPLLDDLGLEGALPWYVEGFSRRSGIQVKLSLPENLGRLQPEVELTLYRIVQEALTNIHRYSGSATGEITVVHDGDRIVLTVLDHGRGFPREVVESRCNSGPAVGVGIPGMRERVRQLGGELWLESGDHSALITAILPLTLAQ
jgi:signal transduction histidine kinase